VMARCWSVARRAERRSTTRHPPQLATPDSSGGARTDGQAKIAIVALGVRETLTVTAAQTVTETEIEMQDIKRREPRLSALRSATEEATPRRRKRTCRVDEVSAVVRPPTMITTAGVINRRAQGRSELHSMAMGKWFRRRGRFDGRMLMRNVGRELLKRRLKLSDLAVSGRGALLLQAMVGVVVRVAQAVRHRGRLSL
jgi:hypothetical protein